MYENSVWRRRDDVTEEWRTLHKEEICGLYLTPNFIRVIKLRRMKWAMGVERVGEREGAYRILVGKLDGKRALRRHRSGWEFNIEMNGAWTGMI